MRLVACLARCLTAILANAAHAQAPSDPQAYCVNRSADFYPYTGDPCKSGYQLGSGNCRKTNGRFVAVPREECLAQNGTVELPLKNRQFPQGPAPRLAADARPQPSARNIRFGSGGYAGAARRRGGQPAIGVLVVGLEKHGLAPITALGDMVGQARHNNARDPRHACAPFGRLRDIHSGAAQSRKLSP